MLTPDTPGCIYAATNLRSGRRYIGKTKMLLNKRIRCHKAAALRGSRTPFHGALRKYGLAAFRWDVLFVSADEDVLYVAEQELIAAARSDCERLYNRTAGGEGATGAQWTAESRDRLRKSVIGKPKSAEARRRMSEATRGKPKSAAHIESLSTARTGLKLKPWTPERRAKMEAAWARWRVEGMQRSPEARAKMSAAAKRRFERPGEREKAGAAGRKGAAARWSR